MQGSRIAQCAQNACKLEMFSYKGIDRLLSSLNDFLRTDHSRKSSQLCKLNTHGAESENDNSRKQHVCTDNEQGG